MLRNGVRRSHGQDRTRTCLHAHVPSVLAMSEAVGRFSDEFNFGHSKAFNEPKSLYGCDV